LAGAAYLAPAELDHLGVTAANLLTNPALDPYGKIPEFKYAACRLSLA